MICKNIFLFYNFIKWIGSLELFFWAVCVSAHTWPIKSNWINLDEIKWEGIISKDSVKHHG